jgi:hypothetical protein
VCQVKVPAQRASSPVIEIGDGECISHWVTTPCLYRGSTDVREQIVSPNSGVTDLYGRALRVMQDELTNRANKQALSSDWN